MPAERFYIDAPLSGLLTIGGTEHHHLAHVMRVRVGDEVELVNGRGGLAKASVEAIGKQDAKLKVLAATESPLPAPRLKLAVPLMRPSKLELVIEKCTELGADQFFLYRAHFSEKDDLSDHQFERLKHIAIGAMKQCGRLDLPLMRMVKFEEVFGLGGRVLFGDTRGTATLKEIAGEMIFITGPEKGFSEKEVRVLDERAAGVKLHKNILRAETAPIVAAVLYC